MNMFLSYSSHDKVVVTRLLEGLHAAHQPVWYDNALTGGEPWWDKIVEKIRQSSLFLFALSDTALESKPCLAELEYARALLRPVVAIKIATVTNLHSSPFADSHVLDFSPDEAICGFQVLAAIVAQNANTPPLPDPLPPEPPIPWKYLLHIGALIERGELDTREQASILEQLGHALDDESDPTVKQEILNMLIRLQRKGWTSQNTMKKIASILRDHEPPTTPPRITPSAPVPAPTPAPVVLEKSLVPEKALEPSTTNGLLPPPGKTTPVTGLSLVTRDNYFARRHAVGGAAAPTVPTHIDAPPTRTAAPNIQQSSSFAREWNMATAGAPAAARPTFDPPRPTAADAPSAPTGPASTAPGGPAAPNTFTATAARQPSAHWSLTIIAILASLLPGLIALYFTIQAKDLYGSGDVDGAHRASARARTWGIIGVAFGVLALLTLATR